MNIQNRSNNKYRARVRVVNSTQRAFAFRNLSIGDSANVALCHAAYVKKLGNEAPSHARSRSRKITLTLGYYTRAACTSITFPPPRCASINFFFLFFCTRGHSYTAASVYIKKATCVPAKCPLPTCKSDPRFFFFLSSRENQNRV